MDEIEKIRNQWAKQRPDINTEPMELIGRLLRISHHFSSQMGTTFSAHGLTGADFDVLATLLRSGKPHALSPNQLLATMMITSGTMTNRIDQLEKKGLVKRIQNPEDKRSVSIALTEKGQTITDKAVTAHVETQKQLVSALTEKEQASLNSLLKTYMISI
ncbi:MarR family transcriptional regulator [Amylibacter sp. SFDW26]|uniref:MarR family winged helix-turn-helix transcriptional regulator n=1 Tax=Amylibacter sp. SFDW26 TaxID=2652722 RepID=UPI001261F565|nr:MarR family transcriptional regulator [Amylibacter sp. SFDW26]KAB7610203.1 MarR family transcriptional regulator [Amylibacter sp. SFDW26]